MLEFIIVCVVAIVVNTFLLCFVTYLMLKTGIIKLSDAPNWLKPWFRGTDDDDN